MVVAFGAGAALMAMAPVVQKMGNQSWVIRWVRLVVVWLKMELVGIVTEYVEDSAWCPKMLQKLQNPLLIWLKRLKQNRPEDIKKVVKKFFKNIKSSDY